MYIYIQCPFSLGLQWNWVIYLYRKLHFLRLPAICVLKCTQFLFYFLFFSVVRPTLLFWFKFFILIVYLFVIVNLYVVWWIIINLLECNNCNKRNLPLQFHAINQLTIDFLWILYLSFLILFIACLRGRKIQYCTEKSCVNHYFFDH